MRQIGGAISALKATGKMLRKVKTSQMHPSVDATDLNRALDIPVYDIVGRELPFKEYLDEKPCLVSLIRHFGCISCAEYVDSFIPNIEDFKELGINLIFVGNGKYKHIAAFVKKRNLEGRQVAVLTEPTLEIHKALGLKYSISSFLSFGTLKNVTRAFKEGFKNQLGQGSSLQQSGILLLDKNRRIMFSQRSDYLGDNPFGSELLEITKSILSGDTRA
jgi:hypothetical protein